MHAKHGVIVANIRLPAVSSITHTAALLDWRCGGGASMTRRRRRYKLILTSIYGMCRQRGRLSHARPKLVATDGDLPHCLSFVWHQQCAKLGRETTKKQVLKHPNWIVSANIIWQKRKHGIQQSSRPVWPACPSGCRNVGIRPTYMYLTAVVAR